ncbi:PREDICTED: cytochrome P450 705A5-like [Camelina sativa]|uniref:Cytochrome P450 705A5-like n=1 Tax=Camelina sativa TaxID=90675 RepID=A0ABM1RBM6_CAMSA|nr:PREDICTED: cytochrome P450 705A5-like [Camelina sativa]
MVVSDRFNELLEKILVEHEKKLDEHHHQGMDLMDALLVAHRNEKAEHKITRNHIKSVIADLLFAGTDNSVKTTQWAMGEIINNPNVLERLRGEIDCVVGKTRLIQETDQQNLPCLQAVVKETIRLHPPGPFFVRFSKEGCNIRGFYVPEETSLVVNAYAVMRDPETWEDPLVFKPERFLASRTEKEEERREKDLLFAGTDNSVKTTQWAMGEIINNPNVLERLRGEIDCVVGKTRLIQETDQQNLPCLQAVVKETIRLHPPGPFFVRFSKEGCNIRGFYVPEETSLVVNAYAVMRDPETWEDPLVFKPERFLASRTEKEEERREKAIKYIPFGSGRRSCPGENLAYVIVGTAIGVMVQGFEWRRIKDEKKINMEEAVVGLSLTMVHPLKITPVSRTSNPLTF